MTVHYVLSIPRFLPTPLNKLMKVHHMDAHRMKKRDKAAVLGAWLEAGFPRATKKRRVSVKFVYPKGGRFHDADNMFKSLSDSLVACGALRNDSPHWVEWMPPEYERSGDASFKTVIVLQDL